MAHIAALLGAEEERIAESRGGSLSAEQAVVAVSLVGVEVEVEVATVAAVLEKYALQHPEPWVETHHVDYQCSLPQEAAQ